MCEWVIRDSKETNYSLLGKKYSLLVLQLLANRGISTLDDIENFFNLNYETGLADPFVILNMEKAVKRILEAKEKKEKIAIFGDYDADGVTASALLFETLTNLGFDDLICYIPDRQLEGYGINELSLDYLKKEGASLIITVDCGITGVREVEKAKKLSIDVIITDHHHVPEKLPEAYAIINPHLEKSGFKFKNMAGVGVAFKLAQALYKKIEPEKIDYIKWSLDLICIGTIADCVPLLGENRLLTRYGLLVLSKTKRVGLQEMFRVGKIGIDENNIPDVHKVAFQIAPRINAAGRIDHANISYNIILEKDRAKARSLALEVESKNQQRQKITNEIFREVQVLANNSFRDKKIIFAENPHWPVGILGLVAGKICDEFKKPTIILQKRETEYVGSLRSIPELDIMEVLEKCSNLIEKFGGHSQAAGITIRKKNINLFFEKISEIVEDYLKDKETSKKIMIDLEISSENIDWELMTELKKMEPFGQGNEEPIFLVKEMQITNIRIVGNGNKHLKLSLKGEGKSPKLFDSIGFGMGEKFPDLQNGNKVDAVFNLKEDTWNGNKKIQLNLIDLKIIE
jgi:single-stranded-DNA-specific exonuclease